MTDRTDRQTDRGGLSPALGPIIRGGSAAWGGTRRHTLHMQTHADASFADLNRSTSLKEHEAEQRDDLRSVIVRASLGLL